MDSKRLLVDCLQQHGITSRIAGSWVLIEDLESNGETAALRLTVGEQITTGHHGRTLVRARLETSLPDGHLLADDSIGTGADLAEAVHAATAKYIAATILPLQRLTTQLNSEGERTLILGSALVQPLRKAAEVTEHVRTSIRTLQAGLEDLVATFDPDELATRDLHAVRAFVQIDTRESTEVAVELLWNDDELDPTFLEDRITSALDREAVAGHDASWNVRLHGFVLRRTDETPTGELLGTPHRSIEAAVEVAVAAVAADPEMSDEALEDLLVERGFTMALAARISCFVPMAFAVQALRARGPGRRAPNDYRVQLPNGRVALVPMRTEPVFVTAFRRAEELLADERAGTADAVARRAPLMQLADRRPGELPPPAVWSGHAQRAGRFVSGEYHRTAEMPRRNPEHASSWWQKLRARFGSRT